MEANTILILKDLDMIYASLYDLFSQKFTNMGDRKFARIAFLNIKNYHLKLIKIVEKIKLII